MAGLPGHLRDEHRLLVVTDCYWMRDWLMALPNTVTRRTSFPPPGVGHQFADFDQPGYTDRDSVTDTIVDMFLLARCNALVYNSTTFNLYGRLMTNHFGGNLEHIDDRFARSRRWRVRKIASRVVRRAARALDRTAS